MTVHHLNDPREAELVTLCHAMAETSLRPVRDVEAELLTMAERVKALLAGAKP